MKTINRKNLRIDFFGNVNFIFIRVFVKIRIQSNSKKSVKSFFIQKENMDKNGQLLPIAKTLKKRLLICIDLIVFKGNIS